MAQHIQIRTECKKGVMWFSLALSVSCLNSTSFCLTGCLHQRDERTVVLQQHHNVSLFTVSFELREKPFDGEGLSSAPQRPWGGVPGEHGHRPLCVGLLAEPGGSAGNYCCLHDPGLRAAAAYQPLEVIPAHLFTCTTTRDCVHLTK